MHNVETIPATANEPIVNVNQWKGYFLDRDIPRRLKSGALVLDAGCADGKELRALQAQGFRTVGFDVDWASLQICRNQGFQTFLARAEEVPLRTASVDGLTFTVVMQLTDEARVLGEFARVLKPGGFAYLSYHGWGYYLKYLTSRTSNWRQRILGLRSLVNAWWYVVTGRRLPGFWGDSLYQSPSRLARYYRRYGLILEQKWEARTFAGTLVFIFHVVRTKQSVSATTKL